jgi:hypothetical protein
VSNLKVVSCVLMLLLALMQSVHANDGAPGNNRSPTGVKLSANTSADLCSRVEAWSKEQRCNQFESYSEYYDKRDFEGVKKTNKGKVRRFGYSAWLNDRKGMFKPNLRVHVDDCSVQLWSKARATVRFTQFWMSGSGRYADQGTKELRFVRSDPSGIWKITREEMLSSEPWNGLLPTKKAPSANKVKTKLKGQMFVELISSPSKAKWQDYPTIDVTVKVHGRGLSSIERTILSNVNQPFGTMGLAKYGDRCVSFLPIAYTSHHTGVTTTLRIRQAPGAIQFFVEYEDGEVEPVSSDNRPVYSVNVPKDRRVVFRAL